jgi:hypothetical protein
LIFDPRWLYVVAILVIMIAVFLYVRYQKQTLRMSVIRSLDALADLKEDDSKLILKTTKATYDVFLLHVPSHAELTINSIKVFEVSSFRHHTYIKTDGLWDRQALTLIVVYPSLHPIKRFINENEMVFTRLETTFDNIKIGTLTDIERALKEETL